MNLSDSDKNAIRDILKREPTLVELYIFDTMWSEHCSYKSSKTTLKKYFFNNTGSEVVLGIGEDSGIVSFTTHDNHDYCIAISHESHNHPSQILPIEGAATGVGGVVRDVYCMGADVVGVLNSLHFGVDKSGQNPMVDEIAHEVVIGVSDYGNPLGVPVLGGETLYHPSYNDNCLVNVAAVGIVEKNRIIRSKVPPAAATEPFDVILVGKSTDATGFGGASFSSTILDSDDSVSNMGAVQVHDPFLKRVLVEAIKKLCQDLATRDFAIGFKDLGAGGISCVTSELAAAGGFGVMVDLDRVNVAFPDLKPEVIACSETQERFCFMVPRHYTATVLKIFNDDFELPKIYPQAGAFVVGQVQNEPFFTLLHQGEKVCNLPINTITLDVLAERKAEPRTICRTVSEVPETPADLEAAIRKILADANACSKRYVYRYFDNAVRGDTVVYPGEADAVVITPVENCPAGLAVTMDSNLYGEADPYTAGAAAVAEAVRNLVSVGARPLAITDCLNYGNPEKPAVFFDFQEGVRGLSEAAKALSFMPGEPIPVISGNVSFYNESRQGNAIVPSPVILAAGKIDNYKRAITLQLKKPGTRLLRIGSPEPEFGGTLIRNYYPDLNNVAPQVRFAAEDRQNKIVHQLINSAQVLSCHDISSGGLLGCIAEMIFGERGSGTLGATLNIPANTNVLTQLFSETGGYVIEVAPEAFEKVEEMLNNSAIAWTTIGHTTAGSELIINDQTGTTFTYSTQQLAGEWNCRNLK